jgi:hypothetical protein
LAFPQQFILIDEENTSLLDEDFSVNDDRVCAASRAVHKIGNWIQERPPFRAARIEQNDVGFLADFN